MTDLNELLRKANDRVARMTPEERAAMWKAQAESFARGMGPCEHGVYDFEDCEDCRRRALSGQTEKQGGEADGDI